MGLPLSHIYGDSQVIINWAKGITALSPPELFHWCRESQKLISSFQDLTTSHIYSEHNWIADRLSKTVLTFSPRLGCFTEFIDDHLVTCDSFQLFWAMFWGPFSPIGHLLCTFLSDSFGPQIWSFWFTIDRTYWDRSFAWWDRFLMGTTLTIACHSPRLRLDVIPYRLAVFFVM